MVLYGMQTIGRSPSAAARLQKVPPARVESNNGVLRRAVTAPLRLNSPAGQHLHPNLLGKWLGTLTVGCQEGEDGWPQSTLPESNQVSKGRLRTKNDVL